MSTGNQELGWGHFFLRACGIVLLFAAVLTVAFVWGVRVLYCQLSTCGGPPRIPEPAIIPSELTSLPRPGQVYCSRGTSPDLEHVDVWQFPGAYPTGDYDSGVNDSVLGRHQGELPYCREVQVLDYAWSEVDGEFWVKVETEEISGWVKYRYVGFPQIGSR